MNVLKRVWSGAVLVALCSALTAQALIHGRLLETSIYMVSTFLSLAVAYASVADN